MSGTIAVTVLGSRLVYYTHFLDIIGEEMFLACLLRKNIEYKFFCKKIKTIFLLFNFSTLTIRRE
jgi:hypothetical protein